ncbi:hypothetical protein IJT10_01190 [bacterium]|nr:hypothetical protein [bacterium]
MSDLIKEYPFLSAKQREIMNFISKTIEEKGYSPTIREICQAVNLSSSSTVHCHLRTLERLHYIERVPAKTRSIKLCTLGSSQNEIVRIRLYVQTSEDTICDSGKYISLPLSFTRNEKTFALQLSKRLEEGLEQRDILIINCSQEYIEGHFYLIVENNKLRLVKSIDDSLKNKRVIGEIVSNIHQLM